MAARVERGGVLLLGQGLVPRPFDVLLGRLTDLGDYVYTVLQRLLAHCASGEVPRPAMESLASGAGLCGVSAGCRVLEGQEAGVAQ